MTSRKQDRQSEQARAAALVEAREFPWTAERLVAALAGAGEAGVLGEALAGLVPADADELAERLLLAMQARGLLAPPPSPPPRSTYWAFLLADGGGMEVLASDLDDVADQATALEPPGPGLWFWEGGFRSVEVGAYDAKDWDLEAWGTYTQATVTDLANGEAPAAHVSPAEPEARLAVADLLGEPA